MSATNPMISCELLRVAVSLLDGFHPETPPVGMERTEFTRNPVEFYAAVTAKWLFTSSHATMRHFSFKNEAKSELALLLGS